MTNSDMKLRQWFTNFPVLIEIINQLGTGSQRELSRFLGKIQAPQQDVPQFRQKPIVIAREVSFTKRQVLLSDSSTADPIGFFFQVLPQLEHLSHPCGIKNLTRMTTPQKNYNTSTRELPVNLKQHQSSLLHVVWISKENHCQLKCTFL